ncbi:hypothetical protein O181_005280 [Austropuccinia psidii MF-1]|uniref:Uncharacterized protein n=1 Tax=Austropuccinia psidii MF-1 TaxID=1389203 RepID=A0A9Q3GFP2_9BASI|nr:hypothetical protein [Austropuccinia psidii MF-1]
MTCKRTPWTQWWMARHCGGSYTLCHSFSNSTGTSNQRTGRTWIKFFSSTKSSKIYFNGAWTTIVSTWQPVGRTWSKFPEDLSQKDRLQTLMVISKGWNPTRQFRLLKVSANRIRENQATIQDMEEQLTQTGHNHIPSTSQGAGQISSPVASNHSETNISVAKSHHSSQFQEVCRRIKGYKGKSKTTFSQRKRESAPIIQKLLGLVKEVNKSKK